MKIIRNETIHLRASEDISYIRQKVRTWMVELRFSLVEQTKVVTAASELARNTIEHGNGGTAQLIVLTDGRRTGLQLIFEDNGPGIPDLELALTDGYSTGSGLGLGLSGSKRLVDEFDLKSKPDKGTCVTITKWRLN